MSEKVAGEPTSPPSGPFGLDDLLAELLERVRDMQGHQQRLRVLLDAVVSVAAGLSLPETLRRIVEAARQVVDARYAALGVVAEQGGLSQFIHSGMDVGAAATIGHLPEGHGILGLLIEQPKPLRLGDLGEHPAASGFPPGHPPMHSFLGMPVTVRGGVFGNLYLTEKISRPAFTEEDEQLVAALAAAAGVAIDNARLYEQAKLRQRWLSAGADVTSAILASPEMAPFQLVVRTAAEVYGADYGAIWTPVGEGLTMRAAASAPEEEGERTADEPVQAFLAGSAAELAQEVFSSALPQLAPDLSVDASPVSPDRDGVPGRALLLPLSAEGVTRGVLLLGRLAGPAPTLDQIEMVQGYVNQVALALALTETQQDRRMLAVYADRDRIARDLHDHVIQRLFSSGLSLQGLSLSLPPEPAAKLERVVQGIDDTIRDLRRTIFSLRSPAIDAGTFRIRLLDVLGQAAAALPHEPRLQLDGPLDSAVPAEVADDALAVLREGVSNAARHAAATSVDISMAVNPTEALTITITDDGRGMPATLTRSSGLTNCRARAESHGGTFEVGPGPDGRGTQLSWSVPVI